MLTTSLHNYIVDTHTLRFTPLSSYGFTPQPSICIHVSTFQTAQTTQNTLTHNPTHTRTPYTHAPIHTQDLASRLQRDAAYVPLLAAYRSAREAAAATRHLAAAAGWLPGGGRERQRRYLRVGACECVCVGGLVCVCVCVAGGWGVGRY